MQGSVVSKRIYFFNEALHVDPYLLGRKGRRLCELRAMQMPTPAAFIITTDTCLEHLEQLPYANLNSFLKHDCSLAVQELEVMTNKKFGTAMSSTASAYNLSADNGFHKNQNQFYSPDSVLVPLLVSVRPSPVKDGFYPLKSVLNVGMNDEVVENMVRTSGNARWVYDTYRKFLQSFGVHVFGLQESQYEQYLLSARLANNVQYDNELDVETLQGVIQAFKSIVSVPQDPWDQLYMIIKANYVAWASHHNSAGSTADTPGIALVIQSMVYGNFDRHSGCGLACSRNPFTGVKEVCGEYLMCAQGDQSDVGSPPPHRITRMEKKQSTVYDEIYTLLNKLELEYLDMQEVEFTYMRTQLFILDVREGTRTLTAAVKILVDLVHDEVLEEAEALLRLVPSQMENFVGHQGDEVAESAVLVSSGEEVGCGVSVGEGVVHGELVFSGVQAKEWRSRQKSCVLCIDNDDYAWFTKANGVIALHQPPENTMSQLKHAHKPVIVNVLDMSLDREKEVLVGRDGVSVFRKGDPITIDATGGKIYRCQVPKNRISADPNFHIVMGWADRIKRMLVKVEARSMQDIYSAHALGADGMILFELSNFIPSSIMRRGVLLACGTDEAVHGEPLENVIVMPAYRELVNVFRMLDAKRATFCLQMTQCDPASAASASASSTDSLLSELRPILAAIVEARELNIPVTPCILVSEGNQEHILPIAVAVRNAFTPHMVSTTMAAAGPTITECEVGVIIETVAGCLNAQERAVCGPMYMDCVAFDTDRIAEDLFANTDEEEQTRSKPDNWRTNVFVRNDQFQRYNQTCLSELLMFAISKCKSTNENIMTIVMGEHCGDLPSIEFFNDLGVNSIACPPSKIPVTKVAAAQVELVRVALAAMQ